MTYKLREYWERRARENGPTYVGPGNRPELSMQQADLFRDTIDELFFGVRAGMLLDFGCGSGRLSITLARYAAKYLGVDISQTGIKMARKDLPGLQFRRLKKDGISLPDSSVDTLAAISVFQHIVSKEDWAFWTGELCRVLRPDAKVLVIDGLYSGRKVAAHMKLRTPKQIGKALGNRQVLKGHPLDTRQWAGILGHPKAKRIHQTFAIAQGEIK